MENGVSDAETALFWWKLVFGAKPRTEEETVSEHRAMTDLAAEAKAQDEGDGWRLEADEMCHVSLGTVHLFLYFAEEVWEAESSAQKATNVALARAVKSKGLLMDRPAFVLPRCRRGPGEEEWA